MPSAGHASTRMTSEDLLRLPEDVCRHELIDGIHYVTPSPIVRHQRIVQRMAESLAPYLREHAIGELFYTSVDVVLSPYDLVVPDLTYISNQRAAIVSDQVRGAPDLAVEVLSPSTRRRDEHAKRRLYDRAGVQEYWIVDPKDELITIYRRSGSDLSRVAELSQARQDILTTPLLPGLALPLEAIFRDPAASAR